MARRLPVIQSYESEDAAAAARPRFHWLFIGAGLTITIWAPLALLATPIGVRVAALVFGVAPSALATGAVDLSPRARSLAGAVTASPVELSFLVAAFLSGALVGRFGGRAGRREAGQGGVIAAFLVSLLGFRPGLGVSIVGIIAVFSVLSLFGAIGGTLGGSWGRSRRQAVLDSKTR